MNWLHIVRIRCEPLAQPNLFTKPKQPVSVISEAILARPSSNVGRGSEWHIGRAEIIKDDGISFQMGRVQAAKSPQFDEKDHSFFEADTERAPFTWGVFDQKNQSCGILKRTGVSLSAREVSSKLEILLNSTNIPEEAGFRIVVDPIVDPEGFIEQLQSAHEVVKFSFTAEFENPFDVQALIQRPAEKFNEAVGGTRTKVEVEGESLDKEILEDLSRAVAATGDDAAASVRTTERAPSKRIYLKGTPLQEAVEMESASNPLQAMLKATRDAYNRLRNVAS